MEEVQRNIHLRFFYALFMLVSLLGIGTYFFSRFEGWSYIDSFYFSTITLTTIGYGDIVPTTDVSKIFAAFYAMFGIGIMIFTLSNIVSSYIFQQEKYFDRLVARIRSRFRRKKDEQIQSKKRN